METCKTTGHSVIMANATIFRASYYIL